MISCWARYCVLIFTSRISWLESGESSHFHFAPLILSSSLSSLSRLITIDHSSACSCSIITFLRANFWLEKALQTANCIHFRWVVVSNSRCLKVPFANTINCANGFRSQTSMLNRVRTFSFECILFISVFHLDDGLFAARGNNGDVSNDDGRTSLNVPNMIYDIQQAIK